MVPEERAPRLRGWFRATRHEPGDASLRDVESELEQFAVDAWRAPEGIRERHGAHEIRNLRANQRSTWSPAVGLPGPEGAEALPVPANYGLGGYEVERLAPSRPPVGEPQPEGAIEAPESGSLRSAAEQGELLSERQVLEREVGAVSERRAQGAQQSECEGHCGPWLARRWPIVQSWRTILANDSHLRRIFRLFLLVMVTMLAPSGRKSATRLLLAVLSACDYRSCLTTAENLPNCLRSSGGIHC